MQKPAVFGAFMFGLRAVVKKPLFFIGALLVSALMVVVGLILSALAALPFVFMVTKAIEKMGAAIWQVFLRTMGPILVMYKMGQAVTVQGVVDAVGGFLRGAGGVLGGSPGVLLLLFFTNVVAFFVFSIVMNYIYLGWIKISVDFNDKGESCFSAFWPRFSLAVRALFTGLLSFLIIISPYVVSALLYFIFPNVIFAGLLFLISVVTSIYFSFKLVFFYFFIRDQDAGIFESIKKSFNLRGTVSRLILFSLLYLAFTFCLGLVLGFTLLLFSKVLPAIFIFNSSCYITGNYFCFPSNYMVDWSWVFLPRIDRA